MPDVVRVSVAGSRAFAVKLTEGEAESLPEDIIALIENGEAVILCEDVDNPALEELLECLTDGEVTLLERDG